MRDTHTSDADTCTGAFLLRPHTPVPTTGVALPAPMYATLGHELPRGPGWTFEPKYDGMRVLADASSRRVRLVTRNGKDKSAQFPEVVAALRALAARAGRAVTLDGEVVARARRRATAGTSVTISGAVS